MKKNIYKILAIALVFLFVAPLMAGCDLGSLFGTSNNNNNNMGGSSKTIMAIDVVGMKTNYLLNEQFNANNAKVEITYDDGSTTQIPLEVSMVTNFNSATVGSKPLTITYQGKTCTIYYYVNTFKLGKYDLIFDDDAYYYYSRDEVDYETDNEYIILYGNGTGVYELENRSIHYSLSWTYNSDYTKIIIERLYGGRSDYFAPDGDHSFEIMGNKLVNFVDYYEDTDGMNWHWRTVYRYVEE